MINGFMVVDNFFDNFDNIREEFKKIEIYNKEEFNKKFPIEGFVHNWPGYRSHKLHIDRPFLFNLVLKEINQKIGDEPFNFKNLSINSYTHLRLKDSEEDWVHDDAIVSGEEDHYTLLVYLSDTNLTSGTEFFEKDNQTQPSATVNFVQNRAVLFRANIKHKTKSQYGDDINNGRLTLNCFIQIQR